MDESTILLIIAIIGCLVGIAGWLFNRDKKTDKDAEWKGMVNAKLDIVIGMQTEMNLAKKQLQDHETRISIIEKEMEKRS